MAFSKPLEATLPERLKKAPRVAYACALGGWFALGVVACGGPPQPPATEARPAPSTPTSPVPAPEPTGGGVSAGVPIGNGPATSACDSGAAANLAQGGVVTASDSGEDPLEGPAAAFDDNTGTWWSERQNPTPWLAYEFAGGAAKVVTQYAISPAADGNGELDPVSFRLEGSNDDSGAAAPKWVTLHNRENQPIFNRQVMLWFSFANATAYRRYRFSVTGNGGGHGLQLAELQLFGPGSPVFSIDNAVVGSGLNQFHFTAGWELGLKDTTVKEWKFGRSSTWSRTKDDTMTFTFQGAQVALYGVRHTHHGIAAISLDNGPEVLSDFYGPTAGNVLFYTSPKLCPPAQHVLKVRVTGDKRPESGDYYLSLDRMQVTP